MITLNFKYLTKIINTYPKNIHNTKKVIHKKSPQIYTYPQSYSTYPQFPQKNNSQKFN